METIINIRNAILEDAVPMAKILREIGWSEKRNSMKLEEVSKPIERLIELSIEKPDNHTLYVAIDSSDSVLGFICVHWVPFIMLGSIEGYVTDLFVSPATSGRNAGKSLINTVMKEGESRNAFRLMVTNGRDKLSYKKGFYKKMGWTERPNVANFVYYYNEPWS